MGVRKGLGQSCPEDSYVVNTAVTSQPSQIFNGDLEYYRGTKVTLNPKPKDFRRDP